MWRSPHLPLLLVASWVASACGGGVPDHDPEVAWVEGEPGVIFQGMTVDQVTGCATSAVRGLSLQLVDAVNCARTGTLVEFSHPRVTVGTGVFSFLQEPALIALMDTMASQSGTMQINSAYRTLAQQYLLYTWYTRGQCGISLAARPGRSNHESGLALDVQQYATWRDALEATGWLWLGSNDPVHFDFAGGGTVSLSDISVLAFQQLWNRNNPGDLIDEDGLWGPQTESRMRQSPAEGFPLALCAPGDMDGGTPPAPDASVPSEVDAGDPTSEVDAGDPTGPDAGASGGDGGSVRLDEDGGVMGGGGDVENPDEALLLLGCACAGSSGPVGMAGVFGSLALTRLRRRRP